MSIKSIVASMTLKVKIIVVCAAVVVTGCVAAAVGISLNKEDSYRVLKVFEMSGEATVTREGSGDLAAYVGMNLENGDLITVGENSNIRLSLDGDKYILLDELTVMQLEATGTSSDSRTVLNLKSGTILNEITQPLSDNSVYEVATPKATMAVRGTSFLVTVEKDENGNYIITESTFHGKVEATLIDKDGNKTDKTAIVGVDKSIMIRTTPDEVSGNPAEIDGTSVFVYYDENGEIVVVPDGEDPVTDIDYDLISAIVKEYVLQSNDTNLMELDEIVIKKLRNSGSDDTQTSADTTASTNETEVTTVSEEPTAAVSTEAEPPAENEPAVTTVPESTSESESEATTVPDTASETEAEVTIVPETASDTEVTTVPETASETEMSRFTLPIIPVDSQISTGRLPIVTTAGTTESAPVTYNVIFKREDSVIQTLSVNEGDNLYTIVNSVNVPSMAGYTGVWELLNDDVNTTAEITSDMKVTDDITVTAVYTQINYTIIFSAAGYDAGQTVPAAITDAKYNDKVADLISGYNVPVKTGSDGSWQYNGAAIDPDLTVLDAADANNKIAITAHYDEIAYTVTFTAPAADDQADVPSDITVEYGDDLADAISSIAVPVKNSNDGFWSLDGTNEIPADTKVQDAADADRKITVTAVYTPYVTVTGASSADLKLYKGDNLMTKLNGLGRTDVGIDLDDPYVWTANAAEWINGASGIVKVPDTYEVDDYVLGKQTVTVNASAKTKITYSVDGTTDTFYLYKTDSLFNVGQSTFLTDLLDEKYDKFVIEGTTNEFSAYTAAGASDITIEAALKQYTVTFDAPQADNQADVPSDITVEYGADLADAISSIAVPVKYSSDGFWSLDGTHEIPTDTKVQDAADANKKITVTAVYTPYVTVTGTGSEDLKLYSGDNLMTELNGLGRTDVGIDLDDPYVWTADASDWINGAGGIVKVPDTYEVNDYVLDKHTVTVNASAKTKITYSVDGTTGTFYLYKTDSLFNVGQSTFLTDLLDEKYDKFVIEGTTNEFSAYTAAGASDITIEAALKQYTVTFDASQADNQSDVPSDITVEYGDDLADAISSIAVPVKYSNDGFWSLDGTHEIPADTKVQDAADVNKKITVTAVYTPYVTVTGASSADLKLYKSDNLMTKLNGLNRTDVGIDLDDPYVWTANAAEWINGASGIVKVPDTYEVDDYVLGKQTVTVNASAKTKITYSVDGTTGTFYLYKTDSLFNVGQSTFLTDLLGEHYEKFVDGSDNEFNANTTAGISDITITAVPKKYTVTFKVVNEDGQTSVVNTLDVNYGSKLSDAVKEIAIPDKAGYTGVWKLLNDDGNSTSEIGNTTISGAMTVMAVYTQINYTITFSAEDYDVGQTVPAAITNARHTDKVADLISGYAVPVKTGSDGYWQYDGAAIDPDLTVLNAADANNKIAITAHYDAITYTITFSASGYDAGQTVPADITAAYNTLLADAISAVAIPTKTNSDSFWSLDGTNEIPADTKVQDAADADRKITVTAVYKEYLPVSYTTSGGQTGTLKLYENDSLLDAVNALNTEYGITDTGIGLDDPYVWVTNNQKWMDVYSGATVKVDATFKADSYAFSKSSHSVYAGSKSEINYSVGTNNGSFYLYDGDSLSDVGQSGYLDNLLSGTGYTGFYYQDSGKYEQFTATTKADYRPKSITAYKYTVTLNYADGTVETYYFGENESFSSKYYGLPTPDADSGNVAVNWTAGSGIFNADTIITGNLQLTPLQMSSSATFSFAFYNSDGTTRLNDPSNSTGFANSKILDFDHGYASGNWVVNGVAIDSTTTAADVFTGSYTIKIVAVS